MRFLEKSTSILIIKGGREFGKTIGILGEQIGNFYRLHLLKMLLQRFPGCGLCRIDIFHGNTLVDIKNRHSIGGTSCPFSVSV
ncbi:hypothetical protein QFZ44_003262 [Pantoea agglomerans]|nr:hypothetical protein [Pantoea agglomerans]